MSNELELLSALNSLASQKPANLSGAPLGVWDDLVSILRGVIQGIINSANNTISGWITGARNWLSTGIDNARVWIGTAVSNVQTYLSSQLSGAVTTIRTSIGDFAQGIMDGINNFLGGIGDDIRDAIGWLVDKINDVVDSIRNLGQTIGNAIANALRNVGDWIKDAVEGIGLALGDIINSLIGGVKDWLSTLINNLIEAWNNLKTAIKEWITNTYETIKETVTNVIETLKSAYQQAKETIEQKFQIFIDWLSTVKDNIVKFFWATVGDVAAWFAREVMPRLGGAIDGAKAIYGAFEVVWDLIQKGDYQGAFDLVDRLFKGLGIPAPIQSMHSIVSALAYFWEMVHLQFVPLEVAAQMKARIALALDPISIDAAAQGVFRGVASSNAYYANASLAGVSGDRAKIALEANRALPTPGAIQTGYLRGEINENEHDRLLHSYGYTNENIELFKALYWLIPPPNDLIRMGVREVFSPEIAEKFGQFQDIPQAFLDWGEKIGLNQTWAKNYWAAHWDLPSATMGFEMLHRGVIEDDELKLLLRALDVMPYWREKLIQISYNPLTRVDIRRMYKMGLLDDQQVKRAYLDLGYNEEKAGWLAEFTKRYYTPEDETQQDEFISLARSTYSQAFKKHLISEDEYRDFLRNLKYHDTDIELLISIDSYVAFQDDKLFDLSDQRKNMRKLILAAYNEGLIEVDQAKSMLIDLGYDLSEANLELSVIDYNRELTIKGIVVDAMHDQYIGWIINEIGLHELMGMWGFSGLEIDRLVEKWQVERSFRTKRPSLSDLKAFYRQGLLSLDQILDELRGLGYHEKYIPLYQASLQK